MDKIKKHANWCQSLDDHIVCDGTTFLPCNCNEMNKDIIIAESNFLQQDLYKIYTGSKEFDYVAWLSICNRLLAIRLEARKDDEEKART